MYVCVRARGVGVVSTVLALSGREMTLLLLRWRVDVDVAED